MNKAEIERLVKEGFDLDQEIKERSKLLDDIKEVLATAANGQACEFPGPGCKVVISFSARMDALLLPEKRAAARKLAGKFFGLLFCLRPINEFEKVATVLLKAEPDGVKKAEKLVALLKGLPGPRVSFREV